MRAARAIVVLMLCATAFAQEHKVGVLYYVEPVFPPIAQQAGVQGDVVVQLDLNESGFVQRMTILSGHSMLNQAALASLQKWHFICLDCKDPVALTHRFTMTYTLPKERYSCAPSPARKAIPDFPHNRMTVEAPTVCIESDPDGLPAREHKVGVLNYELPPYPPIARAARVTGDVKVMFSVDYAGKTSVQSVEGHPILKAQFAELLKKWQLICISCKFAETTQQEVRFRFFLDDESGTWPERYELQFPNEVRVVSYSFQEVLSQPTVRKRRAKCLYLWSCA